MHLFDDRVSRYHLRLETLTRLRWLAVGGQFLAVAVTWLWISTTFPVVPCLLLIGCSAGLNVFLTLRFPATHRLTPEAALAVLGFDLLQLLGLLFMTGGIANPFAILVCVQVIISSASQPVRYTIALFLVAVIGVTLLAALSLPLPWYANTTFELPLLLHAGVWTSILFTTGFAAFYVYRVSSEANLLADALAATELTLQREQHLSALDGLAAAAAHELGTPLATISLVAREMQRALGDDERYREDVELMRSQSERCRDILRRITSLSTDDEAQMRRLPLSSLVEEVIAPHREFGIELTNSIEGTGGEPVGTRNPGILYGLGNLVENAVDFAETAVHVAVSYDRATVTMTIGDDGPGFPADVINQIGEPFLTRRTRAEQAGAGGLGLGLFIAKTLLERSGARLSFTNTPGAAVMITWPRVKMERVQPKPNVAPVPAADAVHG
ncbi:ActS/PrrB/RegB family redox-sensitive histidine kinase [Pararhizobium mangrovi]|uniref:histidine kinase n=1 Tax=Pararhizobium mangrovi TaxID=2590452 RepID=A0A506U9B6_9HYPH|nr:ActS/PrrB/RegB family redox-sensitive histidine kinase [Pararhizobium mangrovi]TPW28417.1 ActS/PrrB/RegB family redox-sensitive histidine kinase [Pararhizobium mangrovi]